MNQRQCYSLSVALELVWKDGQNRLVPARLEVGVVRSRAIIPERKLEVKRCKVDASLCQ